MKDKDFLEVSAFVSVLKSRLFSNNLFKKASESSDFFSTLELFNIQGDYNFSECKSPADVDLVLKNSLEDSYSVIYNYLYDPIILDVLAVRYEFENLKLSFLDYLDFPASSKALPLIGSVPVQEYKSFFEHQDPFETTIPDYLLIPAQNALKSVSNGEDLINAQNSFAQSMFSRMLELGTKIDNSFITDVIETMIDFQNILSLLKIKTGHHDPSSLDALLITGGKTSTSFFLTGLTRSLQAAIPAIYHKHFSEEIEESVQFFIKNDDFSIFIHLLRHIQVKLTENSDLVEYGPEIPFSYILNKENELNQIRTILYGKYDNISNDKIIAKLFLK